MINSDYSFEQISEFINSSDAVVVSSLREAFNDDSEYYLSTQIEIMSIKKYLEATKYLELIDWDKVGENIRSTTRKSPNEDYKDEPAPAQAVGLIPERSGGGLPDPRQEARSVECLRGGNGSK